jgi:hypothetical protein
MLNKTCYFVLLLGLVLAGRATAQLNDGAVGPSLATLFPGATFDQVVPTQEQVTGVAPAARPLRPEEVLRYFEALAAAVPQARLVEFGRTYEGRPLVVLAVSDAATVQDLTAFQLNHRAVLDPRIESAGRPATKPVAWLAYGIHGDELSSTDAAAALAYWLVAGTDPEAQRLRRELLVLIDPCENPDGRTRYLAQTTSFAHRTASPDQDDLSHRGAWPWGRGNHYLFDMNRDWFTMLLPESARSREISAWLPQMIVDSHEMGANSSYLFPPARHPFNPHLPSITQKWVQSVSDAQATALDQRGYPASGTRSSFRATARPGPRTTGRSASCTRCPAPPAPWSGSATARCAPLPPRSSTRSPRRSPISPSWPTMPPGSCPTRWPGGVKP